MFCCFLIEYSFKESRMAARSRNTCSTYAIRKLKRLSITILSFAFCYIGIGLSGYELLIYLFTFLGACEL